MEQYKQQQENRRTIQANRHVAHDESETDAATNNEHSDASFP